MSDIKIIGIIGNGRIAKECAAILMAHPGCALKCVVIDDSRDNISFDLRKYCEIGGLNYIVSGNINSQEVIEYFQSEKVSLIFSINNHQIIRGKLLGVPREGIINFHNGPLPKYGGLNACSWAIFNGETQHGITWHYVNAGIDEGDIVVQKIFDIGPNITALQLIMACINEGISAFKKVVVDVLDGAVTRSPQNRALRTYHFSQEVPSEGVVDFSQDFYSIDRLIRALNFNPLESSMRHPLVEINKKKFYIDKVKLVKRVQLGDCGEVISAGDRLEIQANGAILEIIEARDEQKNRTSIKNIIDKFSIKQGMKVGGYEF